MYEKRVGNNREIKPDNTGNANTFTPGHRPNALQAGGTATCGVSSFLKVTDVKLGQIGSDSGPDVLERSRKFKKRPAHKNSYAVHRFGADPEFMQHAVPHFDGKRDSQCKQFWWKK
jgi:hypothetical protein